jgi:hypothetical protein
MRSGEIGPKLKTPQQAWALWHFLVNDPAAGCHPLNLVRVDDSGISYTVSVLDSAVKHVRYCFYAAVGVPRKAGDVISLVIRMEVIQQQERIQFWDMLISESALQTYAGALESRNASPYLSHLAYGVHVPTI